MVQCPVLPRAFYDRDPVIVAQELLGKQVVREEGDDVLTGIIVETEAYLAAQDPANHGDRLRPQLIELTIFAPTLLGPSGGVATNLRWASATRAERKDSALYACPHERRDNSSTSA